MRVFKRGSTRWDVTRTCVHVDFWLWCVNVIPGVCSSHQGDQTHQALASEHSAVSFILPGRATRVFAISTPVQQKSRRRPRKSIAGLSNETFAPCSPGGVLRELADEPRLSDLAPRSDVVCSRHVKHLPPHDTGQPEYSCPFRFTGCRCA